jgi:hypothetical protein
MVYAGLFAAFGRKLGYVKPQLWLNQTCFNDITAGDNGFFYAGPGPDPCSGLGSPIGTRLARLFKATTQVGAPVQWRRERTARRSNAWTAAICVLH